jgi:hypothetical protein
MLCNIFAVIGIGMLAIAGFLAAKEHRWLRAAQVTEGHVVELAESRGSKGGRTYTPRVQFVGRDGVTRSFLRGYASNPAGFAVGDKVAVAYDADFSGRILSFGSRFGFPLVVGAVGLMILTISAGLIVGRQYVPRVYLERDSMVLER